MKDLLAKLTKPLLLLLSTISLGATQLHAQEESAQPLVIDSVAFIESSSPTPPAANADWRGIL